MTSNSVSDARSIHGIILVLAAIMPAMAIISLVPVMPLLGQEFASTPGSEALVPIALTIPALCVAIFLHSRVGYLTESVGKCCCFSRCSRTHASVPSHSF